jgi:diketogulonate reductase-like aldo/keto reductase
MTKITSPLSIPRFIYGTAWKENETQACVFSALSAGFRAIDTANQRKHYFEEGVGLALTQAYSELGLKREDIFLQSKFTYAFAQDHRKPYDENSAPRDQVQHSFKSSLQHLGTSYLDSLILHGPSISEGLEDTDWETWRAMEEILDTGRVKAIGISNVRINQLSELWEKAQHKPSFVQNRCFADKGWDKEVRTFCAEKKIGYQGFSLLTANSKFLGAASTKVEGRNTPRLDFDPNDSRFYTALKPLGEAKDKSVQQIIFRFAIQLGMIPITGTRSPEHMETDLQIDDFKLSSEQMNKLENIAF